MAVVMPAKAPGSSELMRKKSKSDRKKNSGIENGNFFENGTNGRLRSARRFSTNENWKTRRLSPNGNWSKSKGCVRNPLPFNAR